MHLANRDISTPPLILAVILCAGFTSVSKGESPSVPSRETTLNLGTFGTIVSIKKTPNAFSGNTATSGAVAGQPIQYPFPRPRLAGWSPFIAITTSDKRKPVFDDEWEHELHTSYQGSPLIGNASTNFIIGILDSGAGVNLIAGSSAGQLGLTGQFLTGNTIEVGGVGDTVPATLTWPVGFFAAGLSAIQGDDTLDLLQVAGHSNVSALTIPPIICGGEEAVSGVLGTAFIAFRNTIVNVDQPQLITHGGRTFRGPRVELQNQFDPVPEYPHLIPLQVGSADLGVLTATYWPNVFDFEDLETPFVPTQLSSGPGLIPFGGWFFTDVQLLEGQSSPTNIIQSFRMLVDTGAQTSIISTTTAAAMSLPLTPDFTVDACGVGGLVTGVPGYYIDFVKINALGGALEFSRAPFVVLDLSSPDSPSNVLPGILGMNFFWNRNITLEPLLGGASFFTVSDPIPFAAGDFNLDLFVDDFDLADLVACQTGPQTGLLGPDCEHIDIDQDGVIDLADVAAFQRCFEGSNDQANPFCGSD